MTTLSQADFRTLQSLGSEMQKLFEADLSPGEKVEFPVSIAEGVGLLPLLITFMETPATSKRSGTWASSMMSFLITSDCLLRQRGRKGFRMRTFRHFTRATRTLRNGSAVLNLFPSAR
jgi:hypothetical protein